MIFRRIGRKARAAPDAHAVIDHPASGDTVDRFAFPVEGWAWLGPDQERIAAIEAFAGEERAGETPLLFPRPDVAAALALPALASPGFRLVASAGHSPRGADIDLRIRARFDDGSRSGWLSGRSVRTWGEPAPDRPGLAIPSADAVRERPSATASLPLPPDHLQVRQVGGAWGAAFYREGRVILSQVEAAFAQAGKPLGEARAILDFGCGCGRVLAGFADLPHRGELWGCDIDAEAIVWDCANLAPLAAFRVNGAMPPTSFAQGEFDAVYSVSVFTHLPEEMQFAWLSELRRIVRPGGVVVASVHGGHYCKDAHPDVCAEVATRGFSYRTGAITAGLPDFYMVAMHSETYVRAKWTRFFELAAYHERLIHDAHDAVVLRRRDD